MNPVDSPRYRVTTGWTPVLDTPDFPFTTPGSLHEKIKQTKGLLKNVEVVLPPGTNVEVLDKPSDDIRRICTPIYPGDKLFIHIGFTKPSSKDTPVQKPTPPSKEEIITYLRSCKGWPYIWGGNVKEGIPKMYELFPIKETLQEPLKSLWEFRGFDCTGLLYRATNCWTPRNSGDLVAKEFGKVVPVQGKEISKVLQPLDLIAWRGHILIVLDKNEIIESRWPDDLDSTRGVVIHDLEKRVQELVKEGKIFIVDPNEVKRGSPFVIIKRWI